MNNGITICVCTFRRRTLFETLASLERLRRADDFDVSVMVIDNDDTDKLRPMVETYSSKSCHPVRYVHAPAKNISIARNAALDEVDTRWLLFIDDDEIAHPDWLTKIAERKDEADAVIGQCIATYDQSLPDWAEHCDFHSNRISRRVENAYTSNALLDMAFIQRHDLWFRQELGVTGGEDTVFFREFFEAGGRIVYCENAIVFEPVPKSRATMRWVRRRMFRAGQTHGLICREFDPQSYRRLLFSAGAKAVFSLVMALLTIPGTNYSRKWLARAYLHAGAAQYRINPKILEEYA